MSPPLTMLNTINALLELISESQLNSHWKGYFDTEIKIMTDDQWQPTAIEKNRWAKEQNFNHWKQPGRKEDKMKKN